MAVKLAMGAAVLGGVAFLVWKAKGVSDAITGAARTDAYKDKGPIGTLAAATDIASGGVLSKTGEYIGGKLADWFIPDPMEDTKKPVQATPKDSYAGAGFHGTLYDEFGNVIY